MINTIISTALSASLVLTPINNGAVSVAGQAAQLMDREQIMSSENMDLSNRYLAASISEGFKENILIALGYLASKSDLPIIDGNLASKGVAFRGGNFSLVLHPSSVFAFHNKAILPEFKQDMIVTQESDFTTNYGYKVVAGLGGNGVCHLASLINKAATSAGMEVVAPVNHNFAVIRGIESQYGTSISTRNVPERQNLYVKNIFDFPVKMRFIVEGDQLRVDIVQI